MMLKSCACATESWCAAVLNSSSLPQYQYRVTCSFSAGADEGLGLIPYFLSCANTDLVVVALVAALVAALAAALVAALVGVVLASSFRMSM